MNSSSSTHSVIRWKNVSFVLRMLQLLFQLLRIFIDAILCIYQFSLYICLWFGLFCLYYSFFKLTFVLACLSYPFFFSFVYLLLSFLQLFCDLFALFYVFLLFIPWFDIKTQYTNHAVEMALNFFAFPHLLAQKSIVHTLFNGFKSKSTMHEMCVVRNCVSFACLFSVIFLCVCVVFLNDFSTLEYGGFIPIKEYSGFGSTLWRFFKTWSISVEFQIYVHYNIQNIK